MIDSFPCSTIFIGYVTWRVGRKYDPILFFMQILKAGPDNTDLAPNILFSRSNQNEYNVIFAALV